MEDIKYGSAKSINSIQKNLIMSLTKSKNENISPSKVHFMHKIINTKYSIIKCCPRIRGNQLFDFLQK